MDELQQARREAEQRATQTEQALAQLFAQVQGGQQAWQRTEVEHLLLVANTRPIIPGAIINVRPIGVLKMEDDGGGDEKIIAVPSPKLTQRYVHVKTYTDLPEITRRQIEHFFIHYKDLEPGKWVKLLGWGDVEEARYLISEAIGRARGKR